MGDNPFHVGSAWFMNLKAAAAPCCGSADLHGAQLAVLCIKHWRPGHPIRSCVPLSCTFTEVHDHPLFSPSLNGLGS